MDTRYY